MTGGVDPVNPRHGRFAAAAGLVGVSLLAWIYLWIDAGRMVSMSDGGMAMAGMATPPPWSVGTFLLTFVMWSVMMVGMMLPSATPAILLYASMARKDRAGGPVLPVTWVFTAGYLAVWTAFSLAATILHGLLEALRLLTPAMASASAVMSGSLLIVAGVYQWLPVKEACLRNCRSPLQFFLFHWHPGVAGAFRMGAEHGLICLGCCWALMLLLFTAGAGQVSARCFRNECVYPIAVSSSFHPLFTSAASATQQADHPHSCSMEWGNRRQRWPTLQGGVWARSDRHP